MIKIWSFKSNRNNIAVIGVGIGVIIFQIYCELKFKWILLNQMRRETECIEPDHKFIIVNNAETIDQEFMGKYEESGEMHTTPETVISAFQSFGQ